MVPQLTAFTNDSTPTTCHSINIKFPRLGDTPGETLTNVNHWYEVRKFRCNSSEITKLRSGTFWYVGTPGQLATKVWVCDP